MQNTCRATTVECVNDLLPIRNAAGSHRSVFRPETPLDRGYGFAVI
jgi:hypothetical protein